MWNSKYSIFQLPSVEKNRILFFSSGLAINTEKSLHLAEIDGCSSMIGVGLVRSHVYKMVFR